MHRRKVYKRRSRQERQHMQFPNRCQRNHPKNHLTDGTYPNTQRTLRSTLVGSEGGLYRNSTGNVAERLFGSAAIFRNVGVCKYSAHFVDAFDSRWSQDAHRRSQDILTSALRFVGAGDRFVSRLI
ncbi:hypothetical protein TWF191_001273 [Orbilia oligospora]|uniref:Uncharacterized protein n=1 Tax=Orbilia oligospora TaxID=2813651 RepID=A0A7C8V580_ORBOL|nr:hypothetical protein TWF191_001273 [Orbilia oligospora]